MRKFFTASLFLVLASFSALRLPAQETAVQGRVWDQGRKEPLVGVTVVVEGTTRGVITDPTGHFTIRANPDEVLVFSFVGYEGVRERVVKQKDMQIYLTETTEAIEDVVVVGYGVQKKASVVGSIVQTKGEVLARTGSGASVTQALQGVMPGVISISTSSKPGADAADMLIRGRTSWVHSGAPMCIVDGVERDFNDIDANEIESLSVLKDASATAVYGVKGANGIILVTTKRGGLSKPKINFSSNYGLKLPTTRPEYADYITTMRMFNVAAANDRQWGALIPESTVSAWENAYATGNYGPNNPYFPEIDWWNEMIKTGAEQNYNVNVGGGTEFMKYFVSLSYFYDGDIFKTYKTELYDPSFYYRRYNWRGNFDFNLTPSTVLSVNLAGKQGHRNQTGYRVGNSNDSEDGYGQSQFFQTIYTAARHVFPITWEDGTYGVQSNGLGNLINNFDKGARMYKYYQNFIDLALKQQLDFVTKGLTVGAKFSYNAESNTTSGIMKYKDTGGTFSEGNYIAWSRSYDYSKPLPGGGYEMIAEKRWANNTFQGAAPYAYYDNILQGGYQKRMYYEFSVNYARTFGDHSVSALGLMNRNEVEGLTGGSAATLRFPYKDEGWVTRTTYNWKERYMLEFNGAYTGSMRFARGERFHFFPSYSVGWRLSDEPFVKPYIGKVLTNFKMRFSAGEVGYDRMAEAFAYVQTYTNAAGNGSLKDNGLIRLGADAQNLTVFSPLFREGAAANVNATWETAFKYNLGFEMSFFNRLTATLDLYKEDRNGILMNVAVPGWAGFLPATGNIGKAKSHGFEVEAGWNDRIGRDFTYWFKGSYALNENRVVYYNDPTNSPQYQKYAGKPIDYRTKLISVGYYSSLDDIFNYATPNNAATQTLLVPGDMMYADYDANGVIEDVDAVPMKYNNYPQQTYSFSLGFDYKGFGFSALFYGVEGVYKDLNGIMLWDFQEAGIGNYFANPNVSMAWTPATAAMAEKPALHYTDAARSYSQKASTYTFRNASYLRLKTVEISYLFSQKVLKHIGVSKLQLYANGNNLLTFTPFDKRTDPELNSAVLYPLVKRYNFGARLSF